MTASGKISVALTAEELSRIRGIVAAGAFDSPSDVLREALRYWLAERCADTRPQSAFGRPFGHRRRGDPPAEIFERVDLLFDAGDAKA
jgi:Arc/MetJ-type ribon-helix-helix transcriptional regulator